MEWINDLALAATILFGIFGLVLTFIIRDMDHCPKRLYAAILSLAVADAVLEVLAKAIYPFSPPFYQALFFIDTVIVPLPSLLVFAYFLYCCGENYRKSPVRSAEKSTPCRAAISESASCLSCAPCWSRCPRSSALSL